MTRKQYDLFNQAISTAQALLRTRIEQLQSRGYDPAMYEGWLVEAEAARQELIALGSAIPYEVWFAKQKEAA